MSLSSGGLCRLVVEPRDGLVDEPLRIQITGLKAAQAITIHARLVEGKIQMSSWGYYITSSDRSTDLNIDPSLGGTYKGLEPMGLFWSMIPEPGQWKGSRLIKADVTLPYIIVLSVLDGHAAMGTVASLPTEYLCQQTVYRWYKQPDVKRKEVVTGNIRATMFIPPGQGPHPGVIDMFGSQGGIYEHRASLLASRGFTTLSLAWFNYKDLPRKAEDVNFKYFCEAVDWFSTQPEVLPSGIGTIGVSKGSDFFFTIGNALSKPSHFPPQVKAIVSIGGTPFVMFWDLKYGDSFFSGVRLDWISEPFVTENGTRGRHGLPFRDHHLLDYSRMKAKALIIQGDDDGTIVPGIHESALCKLSPDKRKDFRYILYSRTGHLIEPPFAPICTQAYHMKTSLLVDFGGIIPDHAKAQEHSWKTILKFFRENLVTQPQGDGDFKSRL